ncbi:hypothetical protein GEMRC1_003551 [Eukaryota sp. GEM-RC1]
MRSKFIADGGSVSAVSALFSAPSLGSSTRRRMSTPNQDSTVYSLTLVLPCTAIPHYTLLHPTFCYYLFKQAHSIRDILHSHNLRVDKSLSADTLSPTLFSEITPLVYSLLSVLSSLWTPVSIPYGFDDSVLALTSSDESHLDSLSLLITSFLATGSVVFVCPDADLCNRFCSAMQLLIGHDYKKLLSHGYRSEFLPCLKIQGVPYLEPYFTSSIIQPMTIVDLNPMRLDWKVERIRQTPLLPFFNQSNLMFLNPEGISDPESLLMNKEIPLMTLSKNHIDCDVQNFVSQLLILPPPLRPKYIHGWLCSQWRRALALVKEVRETLEGDDPLKLSVPFYVLAMAEELQFGTWIDYENGMAKQAFKFLSEL